MSKLYTEEKVKELLTSLLFKSPSMVFLYPDETVNDIDYKGMFGFNNWIKDNLNNENQNSDIKEHLQFIYQRMRLNHGESSNVDYMIKFEEIINNL